MSSTYIDVVIDTDPQDIMDGFVTFMQTVVPGWEPSPGQLDVWIAMMLAPEAADSRDIASRVPKSIFRWFGANLVNVPPVDATSATVLSTWTVANNAGYTIPAGTQVTIAATGTDVYAFETTVDVVIPPGSTTATNVLLQAVEAGVVYSGLGSAGTQATLIDPLSFVTTIVLASTTTGGADAEDDDTYLNRLRADLQLLAPRPILPADFAVFARQIAGVGRATAIDGYNPFHNLLTANEASAETDASGWGITANATLSSTAAQAADGAKSVGVTSVAAGTMGAAAPATAAAGKAVTPGDTITGIVNVRAATVARSCQAILQWVDGTNTIVSQTLGVAANDSTTAWTTYTVTGTAPATAVRCRVAVQMLATSAAGELHYVDKASIRRGVTADWVPGGTAETGNARTLSVAATDILGAALDSTHKAAVDADLQSRREINFLIYVVDPTISALDITYSVKALAGYDTTALVTAVNAALAQYLNPAIWGADDNPVNWNNNPVVRYLEVAQIINQVTGVDYIITLQMALHSFTLGSVDVTLPGIAPLPTTTGGTISGSAS